jgi:hypothetical protein
MRPPGRRKGGTDRRAQQLIPLSADEIRRLLAALILAPITRVDHVLHWSRWRRRRQYRARERTAF